MTLVRTLLAGVALGGTLAVGAVAPASAGVTIGIGVPAPGYYHPGYYRDWCYHHPYRCDNYGEYYGPPPEEGVYVNGMGFWWGNHWYRHRGWGHGHWRYY